jgi:hypothetical protein
MTQIMIDVKPETAQHIHAMLGAHPGLSFDKPAGHMLDAQVALPARSGAHETGASAAYRV